MKLFQTRSHTPYLVLSALVLGTLGPGCTSHEEKATRAIEEAVQSCRDAPADEPFFAFKRFDGEHDEILRAACLLEIENFEISNNLIASASTGPVVWNAQRSPETDGWSVASADWSDLVRARRALDTSDPTQEQLAYASEHLDSAQKSVPDSAWLRLARLDALLKLRTLTRTPTTPEPTTIGPEAQAQFEQTLAWAKDHDDLNTQVEAQYMVFNHLQKYLDRVEAILESDGSSDEWLIKSAELAEKEGRTEDAQQYRQELEDTVKKRAEDHATYTEREAKLRAAICEQLATLSPTGVTDTALAARVSAAKKSTDCMPRAAEAAPTDP